VKVLPDTLIIPPRIVTRRGSAATLPGECAAFGRRGMLVHGRSLAESGALNRILENTGDAEVSCWMHPGGEPTLEQVAQLRESARSQAAQWIAAVGGGSVIDVAKAGAGLLRADLPVADYHAGETIPPSRVPFVAVPTTAGTGSEVTTVCVLTDPRGPLKRSIRHDSFMARLVLLDAGLLSSCPGQIIASSGMDAFTQAVEAYVSKRATWFSDQVALKAAGLVAHALEPAHGGATGQELDDLLLGSCMAGIALAHARLGVVHGLAHPLGARYHLPHGLVCGVCLPAAIRFNREAMGDKYARLSDVVGGDLLDRTERLLSSLGVQSPFAGMVPDDVPGIVAETLASGSTAANPRPVDAGAVQALLDDICSPA